MSAAFLAQLLKQANAGPGWATGTLPRPNQTLIDSALVQLKWRPTSTRRGDPPVSTLRPVSKERARPNSISATVGLGQQPLHTDGAHLLQVPDLVLLISSEPNSTPTRIGRVRRTSTTETTAGRLLPGLRDGIFLVNSGPRSFLAAAYSSEGLRYDPGCMTPCDQQAAELAGLLSREEHVTEEVPWTEENQVVLIQNRRILHGRAAVTDADHDRELQRIAICVE